MLAKNCGSWGDLSNVGGCGVSCLAGCFADFSPSDPPADGIFPGKWGGLERKGGGTPTLRRLVLRRPSANGRQEQENTPVL